MQEALQVALVMLGADAVEEALVVGVGEVAGPQMVCEPFFQTGDSLFVVVAAPCVPVGVE